MSLSIESNLTQYEKKYQSQIIKIHPSSISLSDSKIICRRCQIIFQSNEFAKHSKSCKKLASRNSVQQFGQSFDKAKLIATGQPEGNELSNDQFYNNLLASVLCFIKTGVQELLANTKYLRRGVVLKILGKKCINFASQIPEIIDENDYRSLVTDAYMSQILKNINDVFSPQLVQKRMSKFSENRKGRIRKKLNAYLKKFQIGPLYSKQKVLHQFERSKLPLMFRQLSEFVLKLFGAKKRTYVHVGLDLLIIFHSMQRFPSSLDIIRLKVVQIMKKYMENGVTYATIEKTTKTEQKVNIYLNSSLIQLLIQFNWEQFAFKVRFYERFTEYFNFSLYSLRRGSITEAEIFLNKTDLNILTNHVSSKNTEYYLVELQKFKNKEFHEYLQLEDEEKMKAKYEKYEKLDRIFPKMFSPLNNEGGNFQFKLQKLTIPKSKMVQFDFAIKRGQNEHEDDDYVPSDSSEDGSFQETILVQGFSFLLKNGIFTGNIFFEAKGKGKCKVCQKDNIQYLCIFCLKEYHQDCLPAFCSCMKFTTKPLQIQTSSGSTNQSLSIKMPSSYFQNNQYMLTSIRKFIHMRGFYFTTTSTLFQGGQLFAPNLQGAESFNIFPEYAKYQAGKYFPPVILGISGDSNANGSGVGLFCAEDIDNNVFIGEYGGDILSEDQMIFIKRRDMSMQITSIEGRNYFVGSVKHCSYVQLINCSKERANCKMILGTVGSKLKLLLYTTTKIKKGSQLLYDYGDGFRVQFKSQLRNDFYTGEENSNKKDRILGKHQHLAQQRSEVKKLQNIISKKQAEDSKVPKQQTDNFLKLKKSQVKMSTNTCYAECLLLIYKYFRQLFLGGESDISKEVLKKCIDPKQMISEFKSFRRLQGQNIDQQDILEFFTFIENFQISNDSPFQQLTVLQTKQCLSCHHSSQRYNTQKQWYADSGSLRLSNKCNVQAECSKCQKNTNHYLQKTVLSAPQILLFTFKRNLSAHMKNNHQIFLEDSFIHKDFSYTLQVVVLHQGQFADSGHYYLRFPKFKQIFSKNKFLESAQDIKYSREVYLAFYQKNIKSTFKRKHNITSKQCGVYFQGVASHNIDKPFLIGKILYFIIFLVCQQICEDHQIYNSHVVQLTTNLFYGDELILKRNERIKVGQLLQLMMVCLCRDAARALIYFFGAMLKSEKGQQQYGSDVLFKNKMIQLCRHQILMMDSTIKYECGLHGSISIIKDLKNLVDYALKKESVKKILSKSEVYFKGRRFRNKNELHEHCLGLVEVEETKGRANFVGFYDRQPIILLNFESASQIFSFIKENKKLVEKKHMQPNQ